MTDKRAIVGRLLMSAFGGRADVRGTTPKESAYSHKRTLVNLLAPSKYSNIAWIKKALSVTPHQLGISRLRPKIVHHTWSSFGEA